MGRASWALAWLVAAWLLAGASGWCASPAPTAAATGVTPVASPEPTVTPTNATPVISPDPTFTPTLAPDTFTPTFTPALAPDTATFTATPGLAVSTPTFTPTLAPALATFTATLGLPTPIRTRTPTFTAGALPNAILAYPNPALDHVWFTYPEGVQAVRIEIYNPAGERVATLRAGAAPERRLSWNTGGAASGIYFYRTFLTVAGAGQAQDLRKLVIYK